jgi:T5orf172 domain
MQMTGARLRHGFSTASLGCNSPMIMPTKEQLAFLTKHGIPRSQLFNATGMSPSQYKFEMKALGMRIAYGVSPCDKAGHTLRTKNGHCVQCGTHHLAFSRRYENIGDVYVAEARSVGLIKIGTAEDADARQESLNYFGYGGGWDWMIKYVQRCDKAGRVEFNAHRALMAHSVQRNYEKQGNTVSCSELFVCSVATAKKAVIRANVELNKGP